MKHVKVSEENGRSFKLIDNRFLEKNETMNFEQGYKVLKEDDEPKFSKDGVSS
jgi:hypothetical protein